MKNFNTNQARHFYLAGKKGTASDPRQADNGDIFLKTDQSGNLYFIYKNYDGILTRTDTVPIKNITSYKLTHAAEMATKLNMHTVAIDTTKVTLANLVGKTLSCIITIHQFTDYDESSALTFVATVVGNSVNTANATAFHKALAEAIELALPVPDPGFPLIRVFSNGTEVTKAIAKAGTATGAAAGVVLVEGPQKYVRGKLSGEPCNFSVAFRLADKNIGDIVWGTDTVAASNITGFQTVPANYIIADLEYFALGERGDIYRGNNWPNNVETNYQVNPFSGNYDILTIEYFWAHKGTGVQQSRRMLQICGLVSGDDNVASDLYDDVDTLVTGGNTGDDTP